MYCTKVVYRYDNYVCMYSTWERTRIIILIIEELLLLLLLFGKTRRLFKHMYVCMIHMYPYHNLSYHPVSPVKSGCYQAYHSGKVKTSALCSRCCWSHMNTYIHTYILYGVCIIHMICRWYITCDMIRILLLMAPYSSVRYPQLILSMICYIQIHVYIQIHMYIHMTWHELNYPESLSGTCGQTRGRNKKIMSHPTYIIVTFSSPYHTSTTSGQLCFRWLIPFFKKKFVFFLFSCLLFFKI